MQSVYQLLVIGLDGSGKTSIIKHLKQATVTNRLFNSFDNI